ncbi:hypothetical protein Hanom_Chr04g00300661 [Helianthus anomalus]
MRGMRPSCTGCVLRSKPNKKWTRGHGMRPSSTGCVKGCVLDGPLPCVADCSRASLTTPLRR